MFAGSPAPATEGVVSTSATDGAPPRFTPPHTLAGGPPRAARTGRPPAALNDLEVAGVELAECRVEDVVVPASVVRAADVHVRTVVGDDQAVLLEGAEDLLDIEI